MSSFENITSHWNRLRTQVCDGFLFYPFKPHVNLLVCKRTRGSQGGTVDADGTHVICNPSVLYGSRLYIYIYIMYK